MDPDPNYLSKIQIIWRNKVQYFYKNIQWFTTRAIICILYIRRI